MNTSKNIVDTLKDNYMPYAMSVIVSRAIPQIDGFKPSHRKLLYTMYKMNLIKSGKTKSANVVGQTMKLNPHGDIPIYETMVRMTKNNESLLYPYVDSKGNFGKNYSRDMKYAASRYTEVKLMEICEELFSDIDKNTVEFVDNYDASMKEPTLLPSKFPNILINANKGIAVGMASSIPSFNMKEMLEYTIAYLDNPTVNPQDYIIAPDFPTGAELILDRDEMREILESGRGSFRMRGKYRVDKKHGLIEIYEIPYTTTLEAIIEKVVEMMKAGKVKEILDIRDETDLQGLKIAIDYRKSQDPHELMLKLFKNTTLEDSFSCNFNVLIGNQPMVLGVPGIIGHWVDFRRDVLQKRTRFDIEKKSEKLNLLLGLKAVLVDIDKVIKIIRGTEKEKDVVPTLMEVFSLNQEQAEYIAEIKLRNLNKEYILKRLEEIEKLQAEIEQGNKFLQSEKLQNKEMINELRLIIKKYDTGRKTSILEKEEVQYHDGDEKIEEFPVNIFVTKHGYFKKITELSLKRSNEQKLKDDDEMLDIFVANNSDTIWFITDKFNLYQMRLHEMDETKASNLGLYLPSAMGFDKDENILRTVNPNSDFKMIINVFENGKVAKIDLDAYKTKGFRKKIQNAYSDKSELVDTFPLAEDKEIVLLTDADSYLRFDTSLINTVSSRTSQGVQVVRLAKNSKVIAVTEADDEKYANKAVKIPKSPKKQAIQLEI
ncbi:MAG: DNA topoisomerase (ATP-hydrolyzing) subunit A [Peptostreptococcaceae bacterium]|nr:DNA topoisomerase (ATP-hydrolyzing) subunit A [Peptostreptococcaceae bacterium]